MNPSGVFFFLVAAYLLGSVPFGFVIGRLRGLDIRTLGSGNVGATNLARALGRRWGVLAFLLDFLKGWAPTVLAGRALAAGGGASPPVWFPVAVGAACVLGHVFSLYLKLRGGKGVATAFGVMTALSWPASLAAGALWLLLFAWTKTVSVASLAAAVALPIALAFTRTPPRAETYPAAQGFAILLAVLIIVRHRSNLVRLWKGKELRVP